MRSAKETLDATYLEMRWRALSLAADFDRIERAAGGADLLAADPRVAALRQCLKAVLDARGNRAEQVQMLLSDTTPPPPR
jgi:hypothetical protein